MKRGKIEYSRLVCVECETTIDIPRKRSRHRGVGHIKDMYCPCCQKETKFFELQKEPFRNIKGEIIHTSFLKFKEAWENGGEEIAKEISKKHKKKKITESLKEKGSY